MEDYKMQLLSLCLLVYIGAFHIRYKRLETYGNRLFAKIIIFSIINVLFDMITVYLIKNTAIVPPMLNRTCHQIFISSLNIFLYLICSYIMYIVGVYRTSSKLARVMHIAPLCIGIVVVLFGRLYYYVDETAAYSYGPAATTCYATVVYYLCCSIYYVIKKWNQIGMQKRRAILPTLLLMGVVSLLQGFFPEILMSAFGVTLVVFCIFIGLENPADYIEKKSNIFNREGFYLILKDLCDQKEYYSVVSVYFTNINEIRSEFGMNAEYFILREAQEILYRTYKQGIYHTFDGCFSIIVRKEKELFDELRDIKEYLDQGILYKGNTIYPVYEIHSIKCNEYQKAKEVYSAIIDASDKISFSKAYTDTLTQLNNRNAYEKDIEGLIHLRENLLDFWYIIMDLNNLKSVNDTYGHTEGDRLLQDCAKILHKFLDKNHQVYRIGGDEFCMLVFNHSEHQLKELLTRIEIEKQKINKGRKIPLSFAIGYSKYNSDTNNDFTDVVSDADKMMYHNKEMMKSSNQL